jgi:3-dehydroquinate synthase
MSILDKNDLGRLKGIIEKAGLPTEMPDLEIEKIIQAMKHDKKVRRGKIRFILLKSIGSAFITDEVDVSLVEKVLVNEKT